AIIQCVHQFVRQMAQHLTNFRLGYGKEIFALNRRRSDKSRRCSLRDCWIDQELSRLRADVSQICGNAGDNRANDSTIVAITLDNHGRSGLAAGPIMEWKLHNHNVSAPTHALSRDGGSSASSASDTIPYISSTSGISSSASKIARTRSNSSV